jgi:hypothetical protein
MNDVYDRFQTLDRMRMPELWGEAVRRAAAPHSAPKTTNYRVPVGVAAAVIVLLIVGLGLLWGPTTGTPDATPFPEATPVATPLSSITGIYTCNAAGSTDDPTEVVQLRADGTLTWVIAPEGPASEGTWSAGAEAGAIRINGEDDPFTIADDELNFSGSGELICTLQASGPSAGLPSWCGLASMGPMPPAGGTPRPVETPDPHRLRCIAAENRSAVDMWLVENSGGGLVSACSAMSSSSPTDLTTPWSLQVGRADGEGGIAGPVLARYDSSQLTGEAPHLIAVVINSDLTATISQRTSLPWTTTSPYC